jgi:dTDP-4-dehydrorhamnose reductase
MKKKIYIAGSGGMLGEAFYEQFKDEYEIKCTDKDVNEDLLLIIYSIWGLTRIWNSVKSIRMIRI